MKEYNPTKSLLEPIGRLEKEYTKWLDRQPVCSECNDHISDSHYYIVDDIKICEKCLNNFIINNLTEFIDETKENYRVEINE